MIRSFYTATSGALSETRNLNVLSNNIGNVNTNGFKRTIPTTSDFDQVMLMNVSANGQAAIGGGRFVRYNDNVTTDYTQGSSQETGRALDFAINGEGFYKILDENNGEILTRDGEFAVNEEGFLVHVKGGYVLDGNDDPILVENGNFQVNGQGEIYSGENYYATIGVSQVVDFTQLIKVGEGVYQNNDPENLNTGGSYQIMAKTLEGSNINITDEMSKSIASSRSFQACSQIMKMIDEMTQKTVNEIARM